jgi:hypothetical protein
MSYERPDKDTIVFQCDRCLTVEPLTSDGSGPLGTFPECWRRMQAEGWISLKHTQWSEYCPKCAPFARAAARLKKEREQQRAALIDHNRRGR